MLNGLDAFCLALAVLAVIGGWRLGFVRRVVGWVGMIGGIALASILLPRIFHATNPTSTPGRFLIGAGILFAGAMLGQAIGAPIGARMRSGMRGLHLAKLDSAMGAVAGVIGLVVSLWIILPTMAQVPGWPSRQARSSEVARWIDRSLGSAPGVLGNLADSLGLNGLPKVFDELRQAPQVAAPPAGSPVDPATLRVAEGSTVKIVGPACDRVQSGSGFVAATGLVVTNAHVVAGTRNVRVETSDGTRYAARVVAFDPRHDLAVVAVPRLPRPALRIDDARGGDVGVSLGYPGGGALTASNYRVSERVQAAGRDIYDTAPVTRDIFILGAALAPGDSGGPLIDPRGEVVGVAFAIAPDRPDVAYAITTDQVRAILGGDLSRASGVGACTTG